MAFLHKRKIKKQSTASYIRSISYYYEFRYKNKNPFRHVKIQREQRQLLNIMPYDLIEDVYLNYEKKKKQTDEIYFRNKVILSLLFFQYVRKSELEELTIEDIDFPNGLITLKGNDRVNKRVLQMSNRQFYILNEYSAKYREVIEVEKGIGTNKFILTKGSSFKLSNCIQLMFQEINKNRRNQVSWNILRNSLMVDLVKKEDLRIVQYKLGHKYISSTEKYKVTDIDELRHKLDKHHPF